MPADDPRAIITALKLEPHPEGGWFRQTWREPAAEGTRPASTAIYYLLGSGEESRWHRVDATEVWHFYAGAPLELQLAPDRSTAPVAQRLGNTLGAAERPQIVVPAGWWQAARSLGSWTLVGCTVAPGFSYEGFELARDDWTPGLG